MTPVRALVVVFLLVGLVPVPAGATGHAAVQTFHGHIQAEAGLRPAALVGQAGPLHIDGTQEGRLIAPWGAHHAELIVSLDSGSPAEADVVLRAFSGACEGHGARQVLLGETVGVQRLELPLDVTGLELLCWEVRVLHGAELDTTFTGEARFQSPAPAASVPAAASAVWPGGTVDRSLTIPLVIVGYLALAVARAVRHVPGSSPLGLISLYHRIRDRDLLDHATRASIYELVDQEPGIHFTELQRRTGTVRGALDHHVRRMVGAGLLVEHLGDGYRCFFRADAADPEIMAAAEVVRSASARCILAAITEHPGAPLNHVAVAAEVSHPTASYHVDRMAEHNLVLRVRQGTRSRLYATGLGRRMAEHLGLTAPQASSKNPPGS